MIIISNRPPIRRPGVQESRPPARRRRLRGVRIGVLLAIFAVIRLTQAIRPRWRPVVGLTGFGVEVFGFNLLSGGMQDASSLVGMTLLLFALMKDAGRASSRQASILYAMRPPS